jgi:hypothetical protein
LIEYTAGRGLGIASSTFLLECLSYPTQVTSILETPKSRRRLIELEDDKLILIKLWGDKADISPTEGDTALFTCLVVDLYQDAVSLNSTTMTTYQVRN